jgi:hypothetical protein
MDAGDELRHAQPIQRLGYARDRVKRHRLRWAAASVVVAGCVLSSWSIGRLAKTQAQDYLYERQAATHVEDDDRVVFEPATERAEALAKKTGYERIDVPGLEELPEQLRPAVAEEPASFEVFRQALGEAGDTIDGFGALLFLHELTSPSGVRRVVAIRFLPWVVPEGSPWRPDTSPGLIAYVFEPGGLIGEPELVGTSIAPMLLPQDEWSDASLLDRVSQLDPYQLVRDAGLRWFAGQPDETDASHFTLAFEVYGQTATVDGFLSADGSTVEMNVRPRS